MDITAKIFWLILRPLDWVLERIARLDPSTLYTAQQPEAFE